MLIQGSNGSFRCKENVKGQQMVHVAQFMTYTNFPLGFANEQVVEDLHSFYDALYHRYRTSSLISSAVAQHLIQSVRHYNTRHV